MAKNKTIETVQSVADFLMTITDEKKRKDCSTLIDLISQRTGYEPKMWGPSIIGFGLYHYVYESGREGDAPLAAISPRANAITFYLGANFDNREELLAKFGKHKLGKGCIHIQKIEDIDTNVLVEMVKNSMEHRKKSYPN
jgi:hypothetical protein